MTTIVYMILVFFEPFSGAPFDTGINTRTYPSLEECLAAIPATIESEIDASVRDWVRGAACVEPSMADAIMGAKDQLTP
ncbi:MAG: hypothetical protein H6842_12120 [Rhodospirillaceae bacterium]|nr:hypothetical protein [Rhodospirillaceae bacterium]